MAVAEAHIFVPKTPLFEARTRDSFSRQGFMTFIGARMGRVAPGFCEIIVPFQPELAQQHGYFHGGVVGAIADNAGAYAAFTLLPEDTTVLTVEYKMNLLAPGSGDQLIARGRTLRAGRSLSVSQVDVFVTTTGIEQLCATALVTLMPLRGRPDRPPGAPASPPG